MIDSAIVYIGGADVVTWLSHGRLHAQFNIEGNCRFDIKHE